MAARLLRVVAALWRLREAGGPIVGLALEPEPECVFETTPQAVAFLETACLAPAALDDLARITGLDRAGAEAAVRRHLGLCLDACHAAVEYERPREAVDAVLGAGFRILKLQVSAGLRVVRPTPAALEALRPFAEGVYLHQTVIRRGDGLERILDLPQALAAARTEDPGDEWRIHFHVPLFREQLGLFTNTRTFLDELLALHRDRPFTQHVEVETYTWDVLPEAYRREPVDEAIARELAWTLERLGPLAPAEPAP
jgi:hypothetical protein